MTETLDAIKIVLTIVIFLSAFTGVLTPRLFNPFGNKLSYANIMAAGVLVSGGFIHLLPDASDALKDAPLPKAAFNQPYPWSYLISSFTMLFLFIFERLLVHHLLHKKHQPKKQENIINHGHASNKPIMKAHHTDHHHGMAEQHAADGLELLQEKSYLSAIMLLLGLGLHSFLAGLAFGAAVNEIQVIIIGIAILSHKYLASFALGCSIYKSYIGKSLIASVGIAIFFSILTPSGIIIGWMLKFSGASAWVPDLFISIASGTFLYVAIFEIIVPEFSEEKKIERKTYNTMSINSESQNIPCNPDSCCKPEPYDYADILRICCLMTGYAIMSILAIWV